MQSATSLLELPAGYHVNPDTGGWESLPWPGDPLLPWNHPDRLAVLPPSLGPAIIAWGERWFIDHRTGTPWRYTPGQKRFLHLWYAVNYRGRFVYRSGAKRGAKGTGKDPFAAAVALSELCGPVKLIGWVDGKPIGQRHRLSLVQIGANSKDQAKDVLTVANAMISPAMRVRFRMDPGITRTQLSCGSRIELLTTSEASTEGDPATAILLNETHHMTTSNGGVDLADVARRNVGKSPADVQARVVEFTNAHRQGQDSVAEGTYEEFQLKAANPEAPQDLLYDSIEAEPGLDISDDDEFMLGMRQAYADAPWADLERKLAESRDSRTSVADVIRYYLNGLAAAEDSWVDPRRFDDLARPNVEVAKGEKVAMFLDCSKTSDATVLSACRLSDGHVLSLGVWRRPHGMPADAEWQVPRETVDAVVRDAWGYFKVVWFGVDPSPAQDDEDAERLYWMTLVDQWHRDFQRKLPVWATPGAGGHSVMFDMRMSSRGGKERNRVFTEAAMQTALSIDVEGDLTHDGDPTLRLHVHNARRRPNQYGVSLGKINRSSRHLVDYAVSMVGARMGRQLALRSPKVKPESGSATFA
ncbi:terminase [Dietzia maris]|uniref:Terminase n=1 Tax=Dietzia maris TaxID=37915 RepID=A0AAE4R0H3_9ACTN|nr:terminase [Dietzia maris]MDV6299963.1 terminase [Dietzia maris]